jgi:hypothetical protein
MCVLQIFLLKAFKTIKKFMKNIKFTENKKKMNHEEKQNEKMLTIRVKPTPSKPRNAHLSPSLLGHMNLLIIHTH